MPIRFQADADFNQIIVSAIARRYPEIDVRTATAAALSGLKDPEVLALAARDGRVLITHDHTTMPRHFDEFIRTTPSPGLIIALQPSWLTFLGHTKDSLWSLDLFRCESAVLRTHWVQPVRLYEGNVGARESPFD